MPTLGVGRISRARWRAAAFLGMAAAAPGPGPAPLGAQVQRDFVFTTLDMDDGLSQGAVEAIVQDSTGFLWIGTRAGVDRFDGREFLTYRAHREDTLSMVDDYVRALAVAHGGGLWIGTQSGGLSRLDPFTGEVRNFALDELGAVGGDGGSADSAAGGRRVEEIAVSGSGLLLLITDVGLAWFDPVTERAGGVGHASPGDAIALCEMRSGAVLAAFSDGALEAWTATTGVEDPGDPPITRPIAGLPSSTEALRCTGETSEVLAGARDGRIWEIDPAQGTLHELGRLPSRGGAFPRTYDLLRMPDGAVWIATDQGVWRLAAGTREPSEVTGDGPGRSIPHPEVRALFEDARGVLWLGTFNGLARLHPLHATMRRVSTGPEGAGLRGQGVLAIEEDARGRLWVGNDGGGVQLLAGDRRSAQLRITSGPLPTDLDEITVFGIAKDAEGGMWIAAWVDGILRVTPGGRVARIPVVGDAGAARPRAVYSVFVDRAGDVWAGSYALGLLRHDRTSGRFVPHFSPEERRRLGSDHVLPITEDAHGTLWIGAFDGGLASLPPDRRTFTVRRAGPEGLSDDRVISLFVDSRGEVWAGTEGGGLNRFDPETGRYVRYSVENGLPHDYVEAMLEDDRAYLWVSTADGLARLDPRTDEIVVFTEVAGLAGDRFFASSAFRGTDGELYFGGPGGITIVDPSAIERRESPPPVALTSFRIQGRERRLADALTPGGLDLGPDENFFAFEFAVLDFVDPGQNRYRYQLEGLDPGWVEAGTEPVANYTSVPPDRYVFRVAARNSEGIWNEDALSIPIRVRAPFHRTLWFRSAMVVLVAGILFGLYSYRLQQLHKRQELRLEIAGKLHDDIGANLSTIALKAGMVGASKSLDDRGRTHLEDVARLARESAHKVRETVWVVNTRYDTVAGLVSKMRDTADVILDGQVAYSLDEPPQVPEMKITMETRQNVYLMFKEVLHNVMKHAEATTVGIRIEVVGGELRFRVEDDGVGFDASFDGAGSGRALLERRAALCRGSVVVDSRRGRGTTVYARARLR